MGINEHRQHCSFNTSFLWAVLFLVLIGGWLCSGDLIVGGQANVVNEAGAIASEGQSDVQGQPDKPLMPFSVRVVRVQAQARNATLVLRGRTEVEARVQVRTETAGMITHIPAVKGSHVKRGDLLCQVAEGARKANLLEAEAKVKQAESTYEATKKLEKRGYAAKLKSQLDRANLDSARAALERAKLDLARTTLEAPTAGTVEAKPARIGDYLMVGGACVTLVRMDPLLVIGAISERDIAHLRPGMPATVKLITGETRQGQVRFVSPTADTKTRTFRVEIAVTNEDRSLRDGVTTDIVVPLQSTKAHKLSQSILTLNDDGDIGVRIVNEENRVLFVPIEVLSDDRDGLWVAGLPENVRVITVGHEYVTEGQAVTVIEAAESLRTVTARARRR